MMSRISPRSTPLHNVAMPNYLPILLFCVIYASMLCTSRGENQVSDHPSFNLNLTSAKACKCKTSCSDTSSDSVNCMSYSGCLMSPGGKFKLGFFVRGGGTYLGIWYSGVPNPVPNHEVIVWVANRDNPIPSRHKHNCSLVLEKDGKLRLLDSVTNQTYWSTQHLQRQSILPSESIKGIVLNLADNGNLICYVNGGTRGYKLWQSFDYPTNTFLYGMDINSANFQLTSWTSPENPAQGRYNFTNSVALFNGTSLIPYWENSLSSLPTNVSSFLNGSMAAGNASSLRLVLNPDGRIQLWQLDNTSRNWSSLWIAPEDQCDLFETCGSLGVCDPGNGFKCKCLPGFKPSDPDRWESKDFSGNPCSKTTIEACAGDVFLRLPMVKVPPNPVISSPPTEEYCKNECLKDCGCRAYSYGPGQSKCQIWTQDPNDIQEEYYNSGARTLSIRVAPSAIDFGKRVCNICGTNVIPYPLSTGLNCGDPNYSSFQCNATNGQVYFRPSNKNLYKVSHINQDGRKFVVQLPQNSPSDKCEGTNNIESKMFNLNESSSPFSVTNCSAMDLIGRPVVEVEMSWKPPQPPACNLSADCIDWPNTSCHEGADKKNVCICAKGFRSDSRFMNCTKVDHKGMLLWVKAGIATTCGVVILFCSILCILVRLRKGRVRQRAGIIEINKDNDIEDIEIPFVDYESILVATDNFSDENKLGAGGFGPVYKGKLVDGTVVAVKRLSAASVQGIEEFRNEVILIAKLQHRNLVRVLAYCIKEEEKILIYEYMSNKSLDAFLFDQTISPMLDWIKRFNIILGIARGLLYLHQDSRLRIIHRDLKPSNILLDEELNPKISDFGLARIAAGNEMATSTARVVGTRGYMSPEYALDGYFSVKSDVYSFGIIVLEIISGKRCSSLLHSDDSLISLLGYVWTLWNEGNPLELVDKSVNSCDSSQVKRCINVGLLCVQEDPSDRPTMSTVLLMLGGDNMNLPYPKQPVFVARRRPPSETSSSSKFEFSSNPELATTLEAR